MKKNDKCWQKLDSPADCYLYRTNQPDRDESYIWSGACLGGVPHGKGVLNWIYRNAPPFPGNPSTVMERTHIGLKHYGQRHGEWFEDGHDGNYAAKEQYIYGKLISRFMRGNEGSCTDVVYDSSGKVLGIRNKNPIFCK